MVSGDMQQISLSGGPCDLESVVVIGEIFHS